MRIIGLDPGGTTGWSQLDFTVRDNVMEDVQWSFGLLGPEEHHTALYNHLVDADPGRVVCESFEYRKGLRDNVELISREYIGVAKLFCSFEHVPLTMQTAAQGKGFWWPSDAKKDRVDRLKAVDLYQSKHEWRHANDSTRHVLEFISGTPELAKTDYYLSLLRKL